MSTGPHNAAKGLTGRNIPVELHSRLIDRASTEPIPFEPRVSVSVNRTTSDYVSLSISVRVTGSPVRVHIPMETPKRRKFMRAIKLNIIHLISLHFIMIAFFQ